MRFADPWFLLLILLIPLLVFYDRRMKKRMDSTFRFSDKGLVKGIKPTVKAVLSRNIIFVRAVCLLFLIIAAARPQEPVEETKIFVEGIDIVLAIDTSTSMRALDFEIGGKRFDRLTVVKNVVEEFIQHRPNDRIGLVAFASLAYTVCPLTLDHDWLAKNLERVRIGMVEDGTAIGAALSGSLNRLKDTKAKDKVIILLTDGRNNAGKISPQTAASAAKAIGVKVYTIGAGTKGLAPYPMKDGFGNDVIQPVEIEIDDELLRDVAGITGGRYFRATDTDSLRDIYREIDQLEKTEIEEVGYLKYNELFPFFLFPALFLIALEIILANTILRRIP